MEKIYGKHSVRAALLNRPQSIRQLYMAEKDDDHQEFAKLAKRHSIPVEILDRKSFHKLGKFGEQDKHQNIFVFADPKPVLEERDIEKIENARCLVALDQISDPANLATVLRSAAFFGADGVIILKNRSVDLNATVLRHAVGGAEFVDIYRVTNLSQSLVSLKELGFWIYGLDERGEQTLAQADFAEKSVFVIGAEGEGLRPKTRDYCDMLVRIPGGRQGLESLNAGVAASITLAEFYRNG
jgi:23S rRNA (guanosine2251-2'-O)-methyltransferase